MAGEIDPLDSKSFRLTKTLALMTSPTRREFAWEFEQAINLWELPKSRSDLLIIPTGAFAKPALPDWAVGSIFQEELKGPEFLNLATLHNNIWYHDSQLDTMAKEVNGHQFLQALLPSYLPAGDRQTSGGEFTTYPVGHNDPIRRYYTLATLMWLLDNRDSLPKFVLDWTCNNISLCAWANAIRGEDGQISVPEIDMKRGELRWVYLSQVVNPYRKALADVVKFK